MDKIETIIKELTPESTVLLNYVIGFLRVMRPRIESCGRLYEKVRTYK